MTFSEFNRYQAESVARACLKAIVRHTSKSQQQGKKQ
ncbi:hypothetical protein ACUY4Q_002829 [Phytobacter sp. AG2a]